MISLLEPAGGLYRQQLEELTEPDFFDDLNLQAYVDAVMADEETKDLKPYFYLFPGNAETAEYRQSVSKELCDPDIRTAVNHFITGITVAERYLGFSEKTNGTQKWKWRLDTIVRYYDSIEEFCNALNVTPPKSQAFYSLHQSLSEFLNGVEAVSLRNQAREINEEFEKMRFHLVIGRDRTVLDFNYCEDDYCNEIRSEFLKSETHSDAHSFTESPFGDMLAAPLEEFIVEQFMKRDRVLFRNLETFCGINREILSPEILNLVRELRFYLLNLDYLGKMKTRNYPIAFPKISEDSELYLDDCYDIVLAEKNYEAKKEVVLNDIMKSAEETAIIVTGPNQGGKTTLARAFGQCAYLGMMGFPVAANVARIPFFDRIFTQFASMAGNTVEGRLEHELNCVKAILDNLTGHSLVVFNELFTSASTVDALSMSRDLMKRLIDGKAVCFVVTHTFELSYDSDRYVSLVATVVEDGSFRRTYRLIRKPADGIAYANSIVGKYKLDYEHIRSRLNSRR